jgi:tetratricopeptide (TPR) repeat protein
MSVLSARLIGPDSRAAGAQIDEEAANLRAALSWSEKGAPATFVRLCRDAGRYWLQRGMLAEGRDLLERAIAIAEPGLAEGDLAAAAARLATAQADYDGALQLAERARQAAAAAGDAGVLARSLQAQAEVALRLGRSSEARDLFEKSLPLAMSSDQPHLEVVALQGLGSADTAEGRVESARRCLSQALERARQMGDDTSTATVLGFLGEIALQEGSIDEAASLFEEELAMARAARHPHLISYALGDITNVLVTRREDFDRARDLLEEALGLAEGMGDRQGVIRAHVALGQVARLGPHDFSIAEGHLLAALATARQLGIVPSIHETLFQLGLLAWDKGDKDECERRMCESVAVLQGTDVVVRAVLPLVVVAELVFARGEAELAARLLGGAAALAGGEGEAGDEGIEIGGEVRTSLGDEAYDELWAEGRALSFPQLVDLLG